MIISVPAARYTLIGSRCCETLGTTDRTRNQKCSNPTHPRSRRFRRAVSHDQLWVGRLHIFTFPPFLPASLLAHAPFLHAAHQAAFHAPPTVDTTMPQQHRRLPVAQSILRRHMHRRPRAEAFEASLS